MSEELSAADEAEIKLLEALEEEPYVIPGGEDVYDHAKAQAFMCDAIDLAHERGLNLLELRDACAWIRESCNAQMAENLGDLKSLQPVGGVLEPLDAFHVLDDADDDGDDDDGQGDEQADDPADSLESEEQTHS